LQEKSEYMTRSMSRPSPSQSNIIHVHA